MEKGENFPLVRKVKMSFGKKTAKKKFEENWIKTFFDLFLKIKGTEVAKDLEIEGNSRKWNSCSKERTLCDKNLNEFPFKICFMKKIFAFSWLRLSLVGSFFLREKFVLLKTLRMR